MMTTLSRTEIKDQINALFTPNPSLLSLPPEGNPPPAGAGNKVNLLFLDVDGVLNSHKIQILMGNLAFPDPEATEKNFVHNPECTDLMAAGLINALCKSTNTFIVLSSSWRIGMELDMIPTTLSKIGINPDLVIGMTDTLNGPRGDQISRFLTNVRTEQGRDYLVKNGLLFSNVVWWETTIDSYAIVDDDTDEAIEKNHKDHFVQTSFMDGLTCGLTISLGKILSKDDTYYLNRLGGTPSAGHTWEQGFQ